jgi:hypothetical protein
VWSLSGVYLLTDLTFSGISSLKAVVAEALKEELKSAEKQVSSLKKDKAKLEQTLLENRMVMGMTIEEQMMLLSEQINLKITIDELSDDVLMAQADVKKLEWEARTIKTYVKNRELTVYGLLEKPVKAFYRKKLLKTLQDTAMVFADEPAPAPVAALAPTSTPTTPAPSPAPTAAVTPPPIPATPKTPARADGASTSTPEPSPAPPTQAIPATPASPPPPPASAPAPTSTPVGAGAPTALALNEPSASPIPAQKTAVADGVDPPAAKSPRGPSRGAALLSQAAAGKDEKPKRKTSSGFRSFFSKSSPAADAPSAGPATPRAAPPARPFPKGLEAAEAMSPQVPPPLVKSEGAKPRRSLSSTSVTVRVPSDNDALDMLKTGEISSEELAMLKQMEEMNKMVSGN